MASDGHIATRCQFCGMTASHNLRIPIPVNYRLPATRADPRQRDELCLLEIFGLPRQWLQRQSFLDFVVPAFLTPKWKDTAEGIPWIDLFDMKRHWDSNGVTIGVDVRCVIDPRVFPSLLVNAGNPTDRQTRCIFAGSELIGRVRLRRCTVTIRSLTAGCP